MRGGAVCLWWSSGGLCLEVGICLSGYMGHHVTFLFLRSVGDREGRRAGGVDTGGGRGGRAFTRQ